MHVLAPTWMAPRPRFQAVVLAGGRSSRLGGRPKALLRREGITLVEHTVQMTRGAEAVVVIGPSNLPAPPGTRIVRERPAFSGPAAALAAGLAALRDGPAGTDAPPWTMALACDMPGVDRVVPALIGAAIAAAAAPVQARSLVGVDEDGLLEPLAALYRTAALEAVFADEDATDRSMRSFVRRLDVRPVPMPAGATDDVDSPNDVARHGLGWPSPSATSNRRPTTDFHRPATNDRSRSAQAHDPGGTAPARRVDS